jgi:hypothetical protein
MRLKDPFSPELGYTTFKDRMDSFLDNLTKIPISLGEAVSIKKPREVQWVQLKKKLPLLPATPWPLHISLTILGWLILSAIGLQLVRRQSFISLYTMVYLAVMCLTPWPGQFNRYLVPLTPFLALSLINVLLAIKNTSQKILPVKYKPFGLASAMLIISLIFVQQSVSLFLLYTRWHQKVIYDDRNGKEIAYRLFFYHDSYRALDRGLDWLKAQAKPDDIVAGSMPHWAYLRTGLKAVMPPFELNPVKAQHLLDSVPVSYLILDEALAIDTRKYTSPVIENFPERWKRVYSASIITESGDELKDRFAIYQRVYP